MEPSSSSSSGMNQSRLTLPVTANSSLPPLMRGERGQRHLQNFIDRVSTSQGEDHYLHLADRLKTYCQRHEYTYIDTDNLPLTEVKYITFFLLLSELCTHFDWEHFEESDLLQLATLSYVQPLTPSPYIDSESMEKTIASVSPEVTYHLSEEDYQQLKSLLSTFSKKYSHKTKASNNSRGEWSMLFIKWIEALNRPVAFEYLTAKELSREKQVGSTQGSFFEGPQIKALMEKIAKAQTQMKSTTGFEDQTQKTHAIALQMMNKETLRKRKDAICDQHDFLFNIASLSQPFFSFLSEVFSRKSAEVKEFTQKLHHQFPSPTSAAAKFFGLLLPRKIEGYFQKLQQATQQLTHLSTIISQSDPRNLPSLFASANQLSKNNLDVVEQFIKILSVPPFLLDLGHTCTKETMPEVDELANDLTTDFLYCYFEHIHSTIYQALAQLLQIQQLQATQENIQNSVELIIGHLFYKLGGRLEATAPFLIKKGDQARKTTPKLPEKINRMLNKSIDLCRESMEKQMISLLTTEETSVKKYISTIASHTYYRKILLTILATRLNSSRDHLSIIEKELKQLFFDQRILQTKGFLTPKQLNKIIGDSSRFRLNMFKQVGGPEKAVLEQIRNAWTRLDKLDIYRSGGGMTTVLQNEPLLQQFSAFYHEIMPTLRLCNKFLPLLSEWGGCVLNYDKIVPPHRLPDPKQSEELLAAELLAEELIAQEQKQKNRQSKFKEKSEVTETTEVERECFSEEIADDEIEEESLPTISTPKKSIFTAAHFLGDKKLTQVQVASLQAVIYRKETSSLLMHLSREPESASIWLPSLLETMHLLVEQTITEQLLKQGKEIPPHHSLSKRCQLIGNQKAADLCEKLGNYGTFCARYPTFTRLIQKRSKDVLMGKLLKHPSPKILEQIRRHLTQILLALNPDKAHSLLNENLEEGTFLPPQVFSAQKWQKIITEQFKENSRHKDDLLAHLKELTALLESDKPIPKALWGTALHLVLRSVYYGSKNLLTLFFEKNEGASGGPLFPLTDLIDAANVPDALKESLSHYDMQKNLDYPLADASRQGPGKLAKVLLSAYHISQIPEGFSTHDNNFSSDHLTHVIKQALSTFENLFQFLLSRRKGRRHE